MTTRVASLLGLAASLMLTAAAAAQVAVTNPWARGTVAGQTATGAFMQLKSAADTTLIGASSPVAQVVEIHEMRLDGGMMKMSAVERLPLPAGKPVDLKPGGYHVMLMGLARPLRAGETVPITLTFADKSGTKSTLDVNVPVKALAAGSEAPTK